MPRQRRAVELLLILGDPSKVAETVGVSRATLWRWRQQPAFQAAVATAEGAAMEKLSRDLLRLSGLAISALEDALSKSQKPSYRLRAAALILEQLTKFRELQSLEQRVTALERNRGGIQ